jgi:hypothetical protein
MIVAASCGESLEKCAKGASRGVIFLIVLGALSVISFVLVVAASMLSSRLSRLERRLETYHELDAGQPTAGAGAVYGPAEKGSPEIGPAE